MSARPTKINEEVVFANKRDLVIGELFKEPRIKKTLKSRVLHIQDIDGKVILSCIEPACVLALSPVDLSVIWQEDLPIHLSSGFTFINGCLYGVDKDDHLVALAAKSGHLLYRANFALASGFAVKRYDGDIIVCTELGDICQILE